MVVEIRFCGIHSVALNHGQVVRFGLSALWLEVTGEGDEVYGLTDFELPRLRGTSCRLSVFRI